LGWVESGWFRDIFAGEDVSSIDSGDDNSPEFAIGPEEGIESVLGFYQDEVAYSRRIARDSSLDSLSARKTRFREHVSLRWVLVHMLEETARHAGHMDILRERIDGRTGD
jgi:hypothetical protein